MEKITCKVERAFFLEGKPVKVGETVSLTPQLALELKNSGKVSYSLEAEPEATEVSVDPVDVSTEKTSKSKKQ